MNDKALMLQNDIVNIMADGDPQGDIAGEINRLHQEVMICAKIGLEKALRIGELLTQQKERLHHGQFTRWISVNLPFTDRTARNYMRLHENRDQLKTETISVLNDAYKQLSSGKPKPDRPMGLYRELKQALLLLIGLLNTAGPDNLDAYRELSDEYHKKARKLSGLFGEAIQAHIAELEALDDAPSMLEGWAWCDKVLGEITNDWSVVLIEGERMAGCILSHIETTWPAGYEYLKAENFSENAFEKLQAAIREILHAN